MNILLKSVLVIACLLTLPAHGINILTSKYNNQRTGANLNETTLKPSNVNVNQFGKLFERTVDGELYCQPLIVEGLNIGGKTRNVVFLVTVKNVAYAFDAEDPSASTPLWVNNFGNPVPASDVQPCCTDYSSWVGTAGTPVIDLSDNSMYFVTKQKDSDGTYHHRLRKIDILTGAQKTGSGLDMTAVNSGVTFNAKLQNQRSAMLLQGGKLYVASGGHNDAGTYEGWILAYNASNLSLAGSWLVTPSGTMGGIWMSGGGPVGDGTNLFFTTGNGDFNANSGGNNYGECFVKLSSSLNVLSWFAPSAYRDLNRADLDLGGAGVMMIPGTRLLVSGGKDGKLYLVDADNMGGYRAGTDACLQSFAVGGRHIHGAPVHFKTATTEYVYVGPEEDELKAFVFQNGSFNTTPVWQSAMAAPLGMPGWQSSVSASGTTDGIVWSTHPFSGDAAMQVQPGIMRAFNAVTGAELYNTRQDSTRDNFGNFAKNPSPVVNNGRVYVPTFSNKLVVYGLFTGAPTAPTGVNAGAGDTRVDLSWNSNSRATSYNVKRSTTSGGPYSTIANVTGTTYSDTLVNNGTAYYYVISGLNSEGEGANSAQVSAMPPGEHSYWAFDESSGTTAADSWGGRHASLVNGATWATGTNGNAVNLDGTDDYVSIPSGVVSTLTDFTIATWVYLDTAPTWSRIFDFGASTAVNMFLTPNSDAGTVRFAITLGGNASEERISGSAALPTGRWMHVAVTLNGRVGRLYVNGSVVGQNSSMSLRPADLGNTTLNWIGRSQYGGDPYLDARVDDFRIYARGLTASEVSTLAAGGSTSTPAPPTGVNAGAGDARVDLSWNASGQATSYNVKRSTTSGGPYSTIASVTTTTYADTAVNNGTTYYYVVSASNSNGESSNSSQVSATPPGQHSYWAFDESSGTTATDSWGGRNGTLVNGATWTLGIHGNAVDLDGTNDHVSFPSGVVSTLTDFTIATWVYLDTAATWSRVFDFGSGTGVNMFLTANSGSGTVRFGITVSGNTAEQRISGTAALPTGRWTHVAVTLNGRVGKLYVDGAVIGENLNITLRPSDLGNTSQNWIGRSQYSADPYADGRVDDFRIYARGLTASEISVLATPPGSGSAPNPPTNLTATAPSQPKRINLTWTQSSSPNITENKIYRSTTAGGPYSLIATISATTSYLNTGLTTGTTYYYRVTAVNSSGLESAYSNEASATAR